MELWGWNCGSCGTSRRVDGCGGGGGTCGWEGKVGGGGGGMHGVAVHQLLADEVALVADGVVQRLQPPLHAAPAAPPAAQPQPQVSGTTAIGVSN